MSQKFHTQIRNGRDRRAPLIGRYCNSYSLVPIVSKDSSLYIKFKSDYHLAGRGFSARYETRKIAFTFKIIDLIVIKLNKFESRVQDDTTEGSSLEFKWVTLTTYTRSERGTSLNDSAVSHYTSDRRIVLPSRVTVASIQIVCDQMLAFAS